MATAFPKFPEIPTTGLLTPSASPALGKRTSREAPGRPNLVRQLDRQGWCPRDYAMFRTIRQCTGDKIPDAGLGKRQGTRDLQVGSAGLDPISPIGIIPGTRE